MRSVGFAYNNRAFWADYSDLDSPIHVCILKTQGHIKCDPYEFS